MYLNFFSWFEYMKQRNNQNNILNMPTLPEHMMSLSFVFIGVRIVQALVLSVAFS
jgi:hypothetical protein